MKSSAFAVAGLLSLALVASITDARKDPGEYWQGVIKNEPIPEAIQGLINKNHPVKNNDCHTISTESKDEFSKELKPRPNLSAYNDNGVGLKGEKAFDKSFEPRPNLSAYNDNGVGLKGEKAFDKSFEPRPNLSAYNNNGVGLKGEKASDKSFEPRPSLTAYQG
ncbi:hypothetical protein CDL12_05171 [Handroanthus impetiginosus]|uniref:Organ specific protein n=1 Tax=Handroanthus impetiginosus TaxID=429701 RepID=A0A2G9HX91_9LAMI|nr:hypothetical protein CDL12_05171 [Handroanthus impetiginosus]